MVENAVPNVAPSHMKVGKLEGGGNIRRWRKCICPRYYTHLLVRTSALLETQ
jgi:hypothetical protein